MIVLDTSVAVKWFKPGERFETEALDLSGRIGNATVDVAANEIITLELVRGLWRTQRSEPHLFITDVDIEEAFTSMEHLLAEGNILESRIREVKPLVKDIVVSLGLFTADAIHLATALYLGAEFFVVDDRHFLTPEVVNYAAGSRVRIVNLPDLIAALDMTPTNSNEATNQDP